MDVYSVKLYVDKDSTAQLALPEQRVESLVNRQMLCDMTAHIENNIWNLKQSGNADPEYNVMYDGLRYRNLNYMITGVRGSGKTTFLQYLILSLTRKIDPFKVNMKSERGGERYTPEFYIKSPRKSVRCSLLTRFDPSFPSFKRGSFLISVVAAMQSKVRNMGLSESDANGYSDMYLAEFHHVMKKLCKGIVRLSSGDEALSNLSEYQAENLTVENAELDDQIRSNFHQALDLMCRIFKKDAFIVSIDDADIHFGQCEYVLEDIRLYMGNRHLVVLMAGDRDLYLERIRELHFKEYNYQYHSTDDKGKSYRMDFVTNHASQYMIKIFPLENQYELRDLTYLAKKLYPIRCRVCLEREGEKLREYDLIEFVNTIFSATINTNDTCVENYTELFLRMPLRSIIQVLTAWVQSGVWGRLEQLELSEPGKWRMNPHVSLAGDNRILLRGVRKNVSTALYNVLRNEIRFADYHTGKIHMEDRREYFLLMHALCCRMQEVEHVYFLTGVACRTFSDQQVALLLSVNAHHYLHSFHDFLSYFIYGPGSVSLYAKALNQFHKEDFGAEKEKVLQKFNDDFIRYLKVNSWESPSYWARHANMIWCHDEAYDTVHLGIYRLRFSSQVDTLKQALFDLGRWHLDTQGNSTASKEQLEERYMKEAMVFMASMSHSEARDNSYFISIFSYMAFMMEAVACCEKWQGDERRQKLIDAIKAAMVIKSCRNPEWLIPRTRCENWNGSRVCLHGKLPATSEARTMTPAVPDAGLNDHETDTVASAQNEKPVAASQSLIEEPGKPRAIVKEGDSVISRDDAADAADEDVFEYDDKVANLVQNAAASLADEIIVWYTLYQQQVGESTDDLSPVTMGEIWNSFYHCLKEESYLAASPEFRYLNRQFEAYSKLRSGMRRMVNLFMRMLGNGNLPASQDKEPHPENDSAESPSSTTASKSMRRSEVYCKMVQTFPANPYFICAWNRFIVGINNYIKTLPQPKSGSKRTRRVKNKQRNKELR